MLKIQIENYGNKFLPGKISYSNHLSRTFEDFILWEKLNLEGKYEGMQGWMDRQAEEK
jgi:hypothetical protein